MKKLKEIFVKFREIRVCCGGGGVDLSLILREFFHTQLLQAMSSTFRYLCNSSLTVIFARKGKKTLVFAFASFRIVLGTKLYR